MVLDDSFYKYLNKISRNIRETGSGSWGGKNRDLLNGTGIIALGEKRETEVKCTLPGTTFLYLLGTRLFLRVRTWKHHVRTNCYIPEGDQVCWVTCMSGSYSGKTKLTAGSASPSV